MLTAYALGAITTLLLILTVELMLTRHDIATHRREIREQAEQAVNDYLGNPESTHGGW